jgi:hypothetical protein
MPEPENKRFLDVSCVLTAGKNLAIKMVTEPHSDPLNIVFISRPLEDSLEAQSSRRKAFFHCPEPGQ